MKIISPRAHGYFDFITVFIFLLAPTVFGLSKVPAMLAYGLACVHLIVTLTSDFSFGIVKVIPFGIHGWIERIVGPFLIAVPFILSFSSELAARNFYIAIGLSVIVLGMFTNYQVEKEEER